MTFLLANTTTYLLVMAVQDFSNDQSGGIDNMFVKRKKKAVALSIRPTEISAERVVYRNAKRPE